MNDIITGGHHTCLQQLRKFAGQRRTQMAVSRGRIPTYKRCAFWRRACSESGSTTRNTHRRGEDSNRTRLAIADAHVDGVVFLTSMVVRLEEKVARRPERPGFS